ncbi:MAG: hypothetical protein DME21_17640, partial [Verrucomicrobia bacterium]
MYVALTHPRLSDDAQPDDPLERAACDRVTMEPKHSAPATKLEGFPGWKPAPRTNGVLRHSPWDALFVALAVVHGIVLLAFPSIPLIALGLWWNANTISHNFIHLPFFRARSLNMVFSAFESLVLGIPQRLWRDRHLAHHADKPSVW